MDIIRSVQGENYFSGAALEIYNHIDGICRSSGVSVNSILTVEEDIPGAFAMHFDVDKEHVRIDVNNMVPESVTLETDLGDYLEMSVSNDIEALKAWLSFVLTPYIAGIGAYGATWDYLDDVVSETEDENVMPTIGEVLRNVQQ